MSEFECFCKFWRHCKLNVVPLVRMCSRRSGSNTIRFHPCAHDVTAHAIHFSDPSVAYVLCHIQVVHLFGCRNCPFGWFPDVVSFHPFPDGVTIDIVHPAYFAQAHSLESDEVVQLIEWGGWFNPFHFPSRLACTL